MSFFSDLKYTLSTPSKKRTYIFIGAGAFLLILIIIIIAASSGSSESSGSSSTTDNDSKKEDVIKTPFQSYLDTKKYLYVWDYFNAENFIKFVTDHKFSKIYLYVGCIEWNLGELLKGELYNTGDIEPKELIKKLIAKNIEVELCIYLNDGVNDFSNVERVPEVAKALAEVQKTIKFTALHFDVEPSSAKNYEALLHMFEDCRKYIKVSAILKPKWLNDKMSDLESFFTSADYYKKFKDCDTFIDAIMTVTDYTDLMAYANTYNGVDNFLNKYETIRKRHNSNIAKPVLELDPKITEEGLHPRYKEDKDKFFNYLNDVSKRFDGVTIHQYQVWYKDLYCDDPKKVTSYYFGTPKEC